MLHTNYSHIDSTILLSTLNIVSLGEQVPSLTKHTVKLQYKRKRSWNQYDSLLSLIVAENHILVLACLREWNTSSFSTQSRFIFALPHHATMWKLCLFNQGQKFNTSLLNYTGKICRDIANTLISDFMLQLNQTESDSFANPYGKEIEKQNTL